MKRIFTALTAISAVMLSACVTNTGNAAETSDTGYAVTSEYSEPAEETFAERETIIKGFEDDYVPETAPAEETAAFGIYEDVLLGNKQFLYVSGNGTEAVNITDVPKIFDPDDEYMKIWDISSADLDNDSSPEAIMSVFGVSGDTGGKLILHGMNGEIYGYRTDSRTLIDLKTDGTFSYSAPIAVNETGIAFIKEFSENGYTTENIAYSDGETFYIENTPVTEEEYNTAISEQNGKLGAAVYDLTEENIRALSE